MMEAKISGKNLKSDVFFIEPKNITTKVFFNK